MTYAYSFFDNSDGSFVYVINTPEEDYLSYPFPDGMTGVVGDYSAGEHYLSGGVPTLLNTMSLTYPSQFYADGLTIWECTGVPVGAEVVWPDEFRTIEMDGDVQFVTDVPGNVLFTIRAAGYKTEVLNVTALDPN